VLVPVKDGDAVGCWCAHGLDRGDGIGPGPVQALADPFLADLVLGAELRQGEKVLASVSQSVTLDQPTQQLTLTLANLGNVQLWSPDTPHLYEVVVTLFHADQPIHRSTTRIGFREARFAVDGFFLNGKQSRLFGLDRHELYPYLGYSAPARLMRRDAEILRRDFHCNSVRCSHYPQSEAFLDACDELGLMVWEEPPGWGWVGGDAWQELVFRDVEAMILRARNHASLGTSGQPVPRPGFARGGGTLPVCL